MASDFLFTPHSKRAVNSVNAAYVRTRIERVCQAFLLCGWCAHRPDYIPLTWRGGGTPGVPILVPYPLSPFPSLACALFFPPRVSYLRFNQFVSHSFLR